MGLILIAFAAVLTVIGALLPRSRGRDNAGIAPSAVATEGSVPVGSSFQAPPANWATSAASAGSLCGRCGKHLSPAWVGKCQHGGAMYAEYPPTVGP